MLTENATGPDYGRRRREIVAADIRQNLTMLGYMVPAVLASGEEAIKKATEQCPDLVLMDIQLKGRIDGIEAAKIVQSQLNVPVVFITVFADEATIQRAKGTEPYGYLVKPFGKKGAAKHHRNRPI